MARLPTAAELSGPVLRQARGITPADTSGLAQGVASFGAAVAGIGEDIEKQRGTADIANAEADFTNGILTAERDIENTGDYGNYQAQFDTRAKSTLEAASRQIGNPAFRKNWLASKEEEIARRRQALNDKANTGMREASRVNLANAIEKDQNIFTDPATSEVEKQSAFKRIGDTITSAERTGLLDPVMAEKWRETYRSGSVLKEAELRVLNDPEFRTQVLMGDNVVDRIIGVESGGKANAKNPNSSATGLGQFIDSTWISMVRKYRPDLLNGRDTAQVLALRNDRTISREMTKAYASENAEFLQSQGVQATDGNVYLSHFLGPKGAVQVLKADPQASIESVVGQDVVNANPFLRGMTASDVAAWAAKKMGGNPLRQGVYSDLSPDQRQSLTEVAQRKQAQDDAAAAAMFKQQQVQEKDGLALRIVNSDPSLTRQQIMDNSVIDDGDKVSLLRQYDEATKEGMAIGQALPLFQAGRLGEAVDPYTEQGRKLVNGMANTLARTIPPDQQQGMMEELARQSGYVPQPYFNGIRAGLASGDPMAVAGAAQSAARIARINPNILGRSPDGSKVQDAATSYQYYTQGMGLTPEQAARKLIDASDPGKVREREAILQSKDVKDKIKNLSASDVAGIFDEGFLSRAPSVGGDVTDEQRKVGVNPQAQAAIVGDYRRYVEEAITETGGDMDAAKAIAGERFKRVYGASKLSPVGSNVVMRYPVEVTYPAGSDGTHEWVRQQAIEALRGVGVNTDEIYLMPLPDGGSGGGTGEDVRAGIPPRYQLFYRTEGGDLQMNNLPFFADPSIERQRETDRTDSRVQNSQRRMIEGRQRMMNEKQAVDDALQNTIGPDWMKARAAETAIEKERGKPIDPTGGGGW